MFDLFWLTLGRLLLRDRGHARRRLGWRARVVRLVVVLLVLTIGVAAYEIPRSQRLRIQSVDVHGVQHLTSQEVVDKSQLLGKNLLLVRTNDVERRLESIPYIARATVHVGLSQRADIDIQERQPQLAWQNRTGMYVVDGTGVVLEKVTNRPQLPVLQTDGGAALSPGNTVSAHDVAFALTLYSAMPPDLRPSVEKVTYQQEIGYTIVSSAGWQAVIGSDAQAGVKTEIVRQVLAKGHVTFVDVSVPTTPYYRTVPPKSSPPA